jgi:hypothetical protein
MQTTADRNVTRRLGNSEGHSLRDGLWRVMTRQIDSEAAPALSGSASKIGAKPIEFAARSDGLKERLRNY